MLHNKCSQEQKIKINICGLMESILGLNFIVCKSLCSLLPHSVLTLQPLSPAKAKRWLWTRHSKFPCTQTVTCSGSPPSGPCLILLCILGQTGRMGSGGSMETYHHGDGGKVVLRRGWQVCSNRCSSSDCPGQHCPPHSHDDHPHSEILEGRGDERG